MLPKVWHELLRKMLWYCRCVFRGIRKSDS